MEAKRHISSKHKRSSRIENHSNWFSTVLKSCNDLQTPNIQISKFNLFFSACLKSTASKDPVIGSTKQAEVDESEVKGPAPHRKNPNL